MYDSFSSKTLLASSHQQPYSFVLDQSNFEFLPIAAGSGTSTESNSPKTSNGNPISFNYVSTFRSGSRIRMVKNSGYVRNVTPFTGIKGITITIPSGTASLAYGKTYDNYCEPITVTSGTRYEVDSMSYFKVLAGATTPYITSISVDYLCDGTGELDPVISHKHHGYHYLATEPTLLKAGNKEFYACSECQYVSLTPDDGEYTTAVLTYELPSDHIAYIAPSILKKPAQFDYPIAVNVEIGKDSYTVDQTGLTDASTTIQSALDYVSGLGGGTVYIPSGKYLLNNQLQIPSRVTLVGDFKGPSASDYGTVFLCNKTHDGTTSIRNNAQIIVNNNAGINGATFYYPNQNITSVTQYGKTIYAYGNLTATISNIFFINAYDGIAVNDASEGAGELVNLENIYGTCLHNGISGYYQSDAGTWNNINISPSYYENALSEYRCNNSTALYKYTRTNLIGMTLGDLDDFSFDKVNIDNANTGIYFSKEVSYLRPLQAFWGLLNDVNLTDCVTGIYAERLFSGAGALFTHSSLGKVINVSSDGLLKLSKCRYDELLGSGTTMIESGSETYQASPSHDSSNTFSIPAKAYYIDSLDDTGVTDVSAALQTEIDKCQNGGVIIIKNGTYRLNNPIVIPNNTMITSFGNSFSRTTNSESKSELVKFISYSNDACVKLGQYSGINGIRIYNVYKDPDTAYTTLHAGNSDSYVAVKAIGNNAFAINTEASYTFTSFDFSNSSNHYMKYCYGSAYETFIKTNGSGKLVSSLSNLTFLARCCLHDFAQANTTALEKYFNFEDSSKDEAHDKARDITRTYCTMIKISGGSEVVLGCFSYGVKTLIESNSANLLAVNTSQDNLKDTSYMYIINGGDAKIVNSLRVFGSSFNLVSGHLEIYSRLDFTNKFEKYYNSSSSSSDDPASPIDGLVEDVLSYCENTSGVSGASRNSSYKYQGSYSWRASSTGNPAIGYSFTARDISQYMAHGYLRFYLYCTNISYKGSEYVVELTSAGTYDNNEICCRIDDQVTKSGWNEIIIKLTDMYVSMGTFDPTGLNYFRFYTNGSSCYHYVDYISFFHDPIVNNPLVLNECETLDNTGAVILSEFRMEGSYSFMSTNTTNAEFVYYGFTAKNISSYMSTGSISFYFYVPDLDLLGDYVYIELSSSGIWDNQEITCSIKNYITEQGWNHVQVPLSSFYSGSETTFVSTNLNFFRLYTLNSNSYFYLDDIRLVK